MTLVHLDCFSPNYPRLGVRAKKEQLMLYCYRRDVCTVWGRWLWVRYCDSKQLHVVTVLACLLTLHPGPSNTITDARA
jgi:hypothetical protein